MLPTVLPREENDFFYDELYGCYLVVIDSQVVNWPETYSEALETFKEVMRVKREHKMRNPENEVVNESN